MRGMVAGAHVIASQYLVSESLPQSFTDASQSIVSLSTYVDKLSSLFMDIGRSAPRHQAMALLYPRSKRLQTCLSEYFIVVVGLCRHLFTFGQKSTVQQFASSLNDSSLRTFRGELDGWAKSVSDEMHLNEAQENSGSRALVRRMFKSASYQQKLASNLRVLNCCSTYNQQTTWKQIRKAGNALFLMQRAEYQEWRVQPDPCTLIYTGKLGSGKSVLLANVVDDLNLSMEQEKCPVTYFFCRHDVPESLMARTIIGSLARQLMCTVPDLSVVSESMEEARFTGDVEEVLKLLVRAFPASRRAYFVLDGLDECNHEEIEMVLQALQKIQQSLKILLCLSLREEPNGTSQSITEYLASPRIILMPDDNPDIEAFIEADLERCLCQKRLNLGDPELVLEIQDALLKGAQGMFLWAALQIQSLCDMTTDQAIRQALADLPKDLSETFSRILQRARKADHFLQAKTLHIVLAAYRPLTTDELREALSVTPGDATWNPSKLLNDIRSALACCGCLLVVDEEESTVRVLHHSFKQYLLNGSIGANNASFSLQEAQRTLADIVVTYLGYGVFDTELSASRVRPVIVQSAPNKVMQTVTTTGSSGTTLNLALKLLKFRKQPDFDMSKTLAESSRSPKLRPISAFPFHTYAKSYWQYHVFYVSEKDVNTVDLSRTLIQKRKSEVDFKSVEYWPQWKWAAQNGKSMVLELLYKTGKTTVNATDEDMDEDDLRAAIDNGNKHLVALLLSTGKIDVNAKNKDWWTPLIGAVFWEYTEVVELLLNTGKVDVNVKDEDGRTPLLRAIHGGYTEAVELLLNTGKVDINVEDQFGWTALIIAAKKGYTEVVELLLSTGKVDVNAKDKDGWTPLDYASRNRHKGVVKLLRSHLDRS